jgi:uncharacterized protein YdeI (YjbR/CyaY-like superfamily)
MNHLPHLFFKTRDEFRNWLNDNATTSEGMWLICYKKHSKKAFVAYDDAVEEAICYGWIDSLIKRIDEDTFLRKFTPRTNAENWSPSNIQRAEKMIKLDKMMPLGYEMYQPKPTQPVEVSLEISPVLHEAIANNHIAHKHFKAMSKTNQARFILWVNMAKTEATRLKRIASTVELLEQNKKLGLK